MRIVNVDIIADCVIEKNNEIGRVRLSVRVFPLCLLNQLTSDLDFCMCVCRDYSSPGIENQGEGFGLGLARIINWSV